MVRYLGPFQTVCNDWNYWWTYLSEHISEADELRLRAAGADQPESGAANNVGQQGAAAPVNGGGIRLAADRWQRVPPLPVLRRSGRQAGQRRLRDRPARLRQEAQLLDPRIATSRSTPTRPAIRARPSRVAHASRTARHSVATRSAVPSCQRSRAIHETAQAPFASRNQHLQGRPDRDRPDRRLLVCRLHQVRQPVRTPVHDSRDLLERQRVAIRLAGADRRGRRGQGDRCLAGARLPLGL